MDNKSLTNIASQTSVQGRSGYTFSHSQMQINF